MENGRPANDHPHPHAKRLHWLHDGGGKDPDGFEWGIYRVKFDAYGQNPEVHATLSDFSDLDREMQREIAAYEKFKKTNERTH